MNKKNIIKFSLFGGLFVLLTIMLLFIDRGLALGTNKEIGMSFINQNASYNYNESLDKISDIFLILAILLVAVIASFGFIQIVKRKSIFKVDSSILSFGVTLIILVIFWLAFEKLFVVNYRPILVDGDVESSYPSTHILLVTFILLSSSFYFSKLMNDKNLRIATYISSIFIIGLTCVLRFASGMHWITDCIGGLLLGLSLYYLYIIINNTIYKSTDKR